MRTGKNVDARKSIPNHTEGISLAIEFYENFKTSNIKMPEHKLTYKLKEAASLLGVSTTSLRRAIKRGLIKPMRAFRHVLISGAELQRFIDSTTSGKGGL